MQVMAVHDEHDDEFLPSLFQAKSRLVFTPMRMSGTIKTSSYPNFFRPPHGPTVVILDLDLSTLSDTKPLIFIHKRYDDHRCHFYMDVLPGVLTFGNVPCTLFRNFVTSQAAGNFT